MTKNIFLSRKNRLLLKEVLGDYMTAHASSLPPLDEPMPAVSPQYENKIQLLIKRQQKFYYYWVNTAPKRAACLFAVLMLLAVVMTCSVSGLREVLMRFVTQTYETFTAVVLRNVPSNNVLTPALPDYLPEGFTCTIETDERSFVIRVYTNDAGHKIVYKQYVNEKLTIDTEEIVHEKIAVGHSAGIYYQNKGENNLIWNRGKVMYTLSGDISKGELLRIANSIKTEE